MITARGTAAAYGKHAGRGKQGARPTCEVSAMELRECEEAAHRRAFGVELRVVLP